MRALPSIFMVMALILCIISLCYWQRRHFERLLLFMLPLAWLFGVCYAQIYSYIHIMDRPADIQQKQHIIAIIEDIEPLAKKKLRLRIKPLQINNENINFASWSLQISARLSDFKNHTPQIGDKIDFLGFFYRDYGAVFPGSVDFSFHRWRDNIIASGRVLSLYQHQSISDDMLNWQQKFQRNINDMRRDIRQHIYKYITGDDNKNAAAIITALTTGLRSDISNDLRDEFIKSGLMHILSISGLHLAIIAACSYGFFRWLLSRSTQLTLRYPIKQIAVFMALPFIIGYGLLSGFSIATQRAMIMVLMMFVAILCHRPALSFRNLALAAMIIIVMSPMAAVNAGFQLSFAAVMAMIFVLNHAHHRAIKPQRSYIVSAMIDILKVTLVASIATAPFILYHFSDISFYGIIGNLSAMLFISIIYMPYLMLYLISIILGIDIAFFSWIAEFLTQILLYITHIISQFPDINIIGLFTLPFAFEISLISAIAIFIFSSMRRYIAICVFLLSIIGWNNTPLWDMIIADDRKSIYFLNHHQHQLHIIRYKNNGDFAKLRHAGFIDRLIAKYYGLDIDLSAYQAPDNIAIINARPSAQQCQTHDIIIITKYIDSDGLCAGDAQVISKKDIANYGSHAILRHQKNQIKIEKSLNDGNLRIWQTF